MIYRNEFSGYMDGVSHRRVIDDMTAADIGLDAVWKPLYPYCREYHIFGHMNGAPIFVENTLWR